MRLRGAIPIPRRNLFICIFASECPTFRRTFRPLCSSFLQRQPPPGDMTRRDAVPRRAKNERDVIETKKARLSTAWPPTTKLPQLEGISRADTVAFSSLIRSRMFHSCTERNGFSRLSYSPLALASSNIILCQILSRFIRWNHTDRDLFGSSSHQVFVYT